MDIDKVLNNLHNIQWSLNCAIDVIKHGDRLQALHQLEEIILDCDLTATEINKKG